MNTFTYTSVRTRAEAVVDQVDMFLQYAGIHESARSKILKGVEQQWLSDIGVYLVVNGKRFLEAEISVSWDVYSDLVKLTPTIRTDLPGWEDGIAPEVRTIGRRFGIKAQDLKLPAHFWVRFTKAICNDSSRYRQLCSIVGVSYGSRVPEWEYKPSEKAYILEDLQEVQIALRSSEHD